MYLNTIKPAEGSKKAAKRVGRGIGSGLGKTCGRGHKGQGARSGANITPGFEGGQMPIQRRLPKFGFTSRKAMTHAEVRLSDLAKMQAEIIDIDALKNENIIAVGIKSVKVILNGEIKKPVHLKNIRVTAGAKKAIESAGGKVE